MIMIFFSVLLYLYTYTSIVIIKFKRSHTENKFRQLDKFTFNLSNFFNEMFSSIVIFSQKKLNSMIMIFFSVLLWSFNEIVFLLKNHNCLNTY
jgi:hypothetical protein